MKPIKTLLAGCLLAVALAAPVAGQTLKIGHCDVELIASLMPEAEQVQQQLRTYEQQLSQVLNVKRDYLETKMREYQELDGSNRLTPEEKQTRMAELQRLDQEIQTSLSDAENKLVEKRYQLLQPLLQKVQDAIKAVAIENGYTYVLNSNAEGASLVLHAPEQDNLTRKVLKKLGVEMPADGTLPQRPGAAGTAPQGAAPPQGTAGTAPPQGAAPRPGGGTVPR